MGLVGAGAGTAGQSAVDAASLGGKEAIVGDIKQKYKSFSSLVGEYDLGVTLQVNNGIRVGMIGD